MNAVATSAQERARRSSPDLLPAKRRVLIVEDDPFSRHLFGKILSENFDSLEIHSCQDFDSANTLLNQEPHFDLLILDIYLGNEKSGVDLFYKARAQVPAPIVVMTSALSTEDYLKLFHNKSDAPPYLEKPFQIDNCVDLIEALTEEKMQ